MHLGESYHTLKLVILLLVILFFPLIAAQPCIDGDLIDNVVYITSALGLATIVPRFIILRHFFTLCPNCPHLKHILVLSPHNPQ